MGIKINKLIDGNRAVSEAFILAAGYGRRLLPLTKSIPKPLVEINHKPMIEYILDALDAINIKNIYINTHYQHEKLSKFLQERRISNIHISYEKNLLDTGGGIRNLIDTSVTESILIINCDAILFDDYPYLLGSLQERFNPNKMDALLALSSPKYAIGYNGNGDFLITKDGLIIDSDSKDKLVFMGISILNTKMLDLVDREKFSLVEIWNKLIKKRACHGMVYESVWCHAGNEEAINLANEFCK
tara:strand:- start:107 stop:838 length:732 start_codon:yes stop_codon:yes gene_type:complete